MLQFFLSFLAWGIAPLLGPLQQIPVLNLLIGLRACKFDISHFTINLQHHYSISSLCILHKVLHKPLHLHSELPNLFYPRSITRGATSVNSLSFLPKKFNTTQYYSKCIIPAKTKLWSDLPSMAVETAELHNSKLGANAYFIECGRTIIYLLSLSF